MPMRSHSTSRSSRLHGPKGAIRSLEQRIIAFDQNSNLSRTAESRVKGEVIATACQEVSEDAD